MNIKKIVVFTSCGDSPGMNAAIAVIIIKPGIKDDVLYFKSESNAKKYIEDPDKK